MARFKGDSSGRSTVQYAEAKIAAACTDLCTHVNSEISTLNTNKLSTSGSGANLTNIVTQVTAGSGITIDQSTGNVTIDADSQGGSGYEILYSCNGCWNGSAVIPSDKRGVFQQYEIMGVTNYWSLYCSQATYRFAGWPGCQENDAGCYCCAHCACGWVGDHKCFHSTWQYGCGGAIPWPFGCDSGCSTACSAVGWMWHNRLTPVYPCSADRQFKYCFTTTHNGGGMCCLGVRNAGHGVSCCGGHPACLKGVCYTTQGAANGFSCATTVTILGLGRLPV